jgi:hypothetical protein
MSFRGVTHYGRYTPTDQVEGGLVAWLEWSLLGIGAFDTVARGQASAHGSADRSLLKPVSDPRGVTANTVWQGLRTDWCWESGVPYSAQPTVASGVYVNGAFYPTASTSGQFAHRIDYPRGQVVFSGAVPATSVVQAAHSYKFVQVRRTDEPFVRELARRSFRADDPQFKTPSASGGGAWDLLAENRVQLPAVLVEPVVNRRGGPLELGSHAGVYRDAFLLHVVAETPWDKKRLADVLTGQFDAVIPTFDRDSAPMPLDGYGRPTASALTYPALASGYPWRPVRVARAESFGQKTADPKLHWATVRFEVEYDYF